ncbi:GNAT family N-acetyltransferase [Legionella pneumophila serogroup 1]
MTDLPQGFILRQIQKDDIANKLSLGDKSFTPLKTFLKKSAYEFHEYDIAKTFVLVEEKNDGQSASIQIWGYITLMNSEIILNEDQRPKESSATTRYEAYPAVKIARLAIDKRLQGKGYGGELMDWCINHIRLGIMPNVGCRFIVVDSKKNSVQFYEKYGFTLLDIESNREEETPLMFFDLYNHKQSDN